MRYIAVYCGSSFGNGLRYRGDAIAAVQTLVGRGYGIVYGGASVGLMGAVADAALEAGGKVIGVIPEFVEWKEITHTGLTETFHVSGMHERKRKMSDLSCAALALPGGLGTIDELIEYATWSQLAHHKDGLVKHAGMLNTLGFYDYMIRHLDHATRLGFISLENRKLIQHYNFITDFLKAIESQ